MNSRALSAYKELSAHTSITEASPVELIILMYKSVIDHLRLTQQEIERGNESADHVSKCLDLIQKGLMAALDYEKGGEIAKNLGSLYDWAIREILTSRLKNNPETLTAVIEVFKNLESAWVEIHMIRVSEGTVKPSENVHLSATGAIPAA